MGDADASFLQEFFDVSVAEREAVIEPDGIADHSEGKPVARKLVTAQHGVTLPSQLATTASDTVAPDRKGLKPARI